MLPDGVWRGMPCGSAMGYLPVYWELTSAGGAITGFRELRREAPVLRSVEIGVEPGSFVIRQGDAVRLTGVGFGCSGRIRVDAPGADPAHVSSFKRTRDGVIEFDFPALRASTEGNRLIVREAVFTYLQGPAESNPVDFRTGSALDAGSPGPPQIQPGGSSGSGASATEGTNALQKRTRGAPPVPADGPGKGTGGGKTLSVPAGRGRSK